MMGILRAGVIAFWVFFLIFDIPAFSQRDPRSGPMQDAPERIEQLMEQISENMLRVGEVMIDAASRELRFAGRVNMATGLIEVLVCTETGKLHESVLVTRARPMHLHLGLVLLGLKDGSNPGWYVPENPAYRTPGWDRDAGDQVKVYVTWETSEGRREVRLEQMLVDIRTGEPLPDTGWVFTGSYVDPQGIYMADEVGSLMTNFHDRSAVLDLPLEDGQVDDFLYANSEIIPPPGTEVEIRLIPVLREEE